MLMGIVTGGIALLMLFGFGPLSLPLFLAATAIASVYRVTMVLAPLFPGTAWCDQEFRASTPRSLGLYPQQLLPYALCGLAAFAVVLALAIH